MKKSFLFLLLIITSLPILVAAEAKDTDGDGKIDRWVEAGPRGSSILKRDSNGDGKVDYELHTTARGLKIYEAMDFNHDGVMDTFYYYNVAGVLERQEIDTTGSGKIDIKVYLRDGTYIENVWKDPTVHKKSPAQSQSKALS